MVLNSAIFGLILVALLVLPGFWPIRKRGDFFLAGRQEGALSVAASLLATCVGASATIGLIGRAYSSGWPAVWWLGAGTIGLVLLSLHWAASMRVRQDTRTLPEWLGHSYGLPARRLSAILIVLMWTAVIAAQWTAAGALLSAVWGWSVHQGIVVAALTVTLYTAFGGQASVLRTDRWQLLFIGLALAALIVCAGQLPKAPTVPGPAFGPPLSGVLQLGFLDAASLVVVVGGMYVVGPDLCSRVLVARDVRSARTGALLAAVALFPVSGAIVWLGVRVRISGIVLENARDTVPWLLTQSGCVSSWIAALISAGLFGAMLSSADTCLLTAGTVFELDLLGQEIPSVRQEARGRVWVILFGMISALMACFRPQIIPNMLLAYAFYAGGLLVPLLMLGSVRLRRRVSRDWVWTAMLAGGITPIVLLVSRMVSSTSRAGLAGGLCAIVVVLLGAGVRRVQHAMAR